MSEPDLDGASAHGGLADVALIIEDLLCQIEVLQSSGGDPAAAADLRAQVELLQGR